MNNSKAEKLKKNIKDLIKQESYKAATRKEI